MNDDSYVQQVFNKDASDSSLMENNPLIRSPSNSWKLNLPSTPHSQDANSVDNTSLSSMLLHEAFSSLSLTDKCALSLSISQLNQSNSNTNPTSPMANTTVVMSSTNQISSSTANSTHVTPRNSYNSIDISGGGVGLNRNHSGDFSGRRLTGESIGDDLEFEMQSVISENDKESLDVAMSMMGAQEIEQVESEVRRIQNNVRGWLLRKNYTNLRDAARVLQVAWREKRKNQGVLSPKGQNASIFGTSPTDESPLMNSKMGYAKAKQFDNHNICSSTNSSYSSTVSGLTATFTALNKSSVVDNHSSRELHAAATLQAATRGMLARRSFSSVRRQTMASLVIQKRLLKWYTDSKSSGDDESSSPLSLL